MLVAIPACQMHRRALEGFEEHIREASAPTLEAWTQMYENWQASADKSKGCPFVAPEKGTYGVSQLHMWALELTSLNSIEITLSQVRLRLAKEEQQRGAAPVQGREETGEAAFVMLGLELEVAQ